MTIVGHEVSKHRTDDGRFEGTCECGFTCSGPTRKPVLRELSAHRQSVRPERVQHAGPETFRTRATDDGDPRPLHEMAKRRNATLGGMGTLSIAGTDRVNRIVAAALRDDHQLFDKE